ncbi:MAG: hypothetical protein JSR57_08570 [Verrucomicrobia bacterium]|nr:hypothetical protein [Verrucomicrobiota bacterium]
MKQGLLGLMMLLHSFLAAHADPFFRELPKAELHLHLGGAYPKSYLFSLASNKQRETLENALSSISNRIAYNEVFTVFEIVRQLVDTETKVQKGVEALCKELKADNIAYVEIRTGLKDLGGGVESYLQAVLAGIEAEKSDRFTAKVLLSLQRNSSLASARKTIDLAIKYQNRGVAGIDLSGDSTIGNVQAIQEELVRAKAAEIPFIVHMGEDPREQDQLLLLELLQPERIGHGVHLIPEAKAWILQKKIPLEVCLTSSVLVQMVQDLHEHPGIYMLRHGHPVIFCTDDPLLFSVSLSDELWRAHRFGGLSLEEITEANKRAFEYALKS